MSRNSEYWQQRFTQLENAQNAMGSEAVAKIESLYRAAQHKIEGQITAWYERLAKNNEISMAEARKWLKGKELREFKWDVGDYIEYGKENGMNQMWMKELENASAKFHISRLEALNISLEQSLQELYLKEEKIVDSTLSDVYKEGYYRTMFELQKGFSIGFDVAKVNNNYVAKVLAKPWAPDKYNFSERIWQSKTKLINTVHDEISQSLLLGEDPRKAIGSISRKMETSRFNAGRLVMTEEAYFSSLAQGECFKELDIEKYEVLATLDDRTSEICQSMDGKIFEMKDYQAGVTAPPFHVFCRSTTIPYFDKDYDLKGERAARNEDGKTYYVPGDMRYSDWKATFVNKTKEKPEKTTDNSRKSGIIKTESEQLKKIKQRFDRYRVEHRPVKELSKELTTEEIVEKLGGGDLTEGSCTSLAFAYIGNKNGLDVTDYRGGESTDLFADNENIKGILNLPDINGRVIKVKSEATDAMKILANLENGKEYYFGAGQHSAIVRKSDSGAEYLELQSQSNNGWQSFKKYGSTKQTLKKRFGCRLTPDRFHGVLMEKEIFLADTDIFKDSDEFKEILGYLNTSSDKQQKGAKGFEK